MHKQIFVPIEGNVEDPLISVQSHFKPVVKSKINVYLCVATAKLENANFDTKAIVAGDVTTRPPTPNPEGGTFHVWKCQRMFFEDENTVTQRWLTCQRNVR